MYQPLNQQAGRKYVSYTYVGRDMMIIEQIHVVYIVHKLNRLELFICIIHVYMHMILIYYKEVWFF